MRRGSTASARLPDMPGTLPSISGAYPMHPMGPIGLVASSKSSATTWWIGGCGRAFRAVHRRRGWFSQHLRCQSSRLAASVACCAIVTARPTILSAALCIALALPASLVPTRPVSPAYATWIIRRMHLTHVLVGATPDGGVALEATGTLKRGWAALVLLRHVAGVHEDRKIYIEDA
ncbi:hypothetical protein BU15DRAFT_68779 [Melanogaster broomeanus]|nr:hypothetical protein BU15DRAFT_68779 [Melanogaster broomeanus]